MKNNQITYKVSYKPQLGLATNLLLYTQSSATNHSYSSAVALVWVFSKEGSVPMEASKV